ncbi:hypothetical protein ACWGKU_29040 [Kitasatospora sp. NPDC054768]
MTQQTTSAFELPERLAAKADPALIADDERHFVGTQPRARPAPW